MRETLVLCDYCKEYQIWPCDNCKALNMPRATYKEPQPSGPPYATDWRDYNFSDGSTWADD